MRSDRRGNMPFAVIAVTLLLMSSVAGAVMATYHSSEDWIDETEHGLDALGRSVDDVRSFIDRELGRIILDISKDDSLGSLDDRAGVFCDRADRWLSFNFPVKSGDITADLMGSDLSLTAEPMGLCTDSGQTDGFMPSYLHGSGTVKVRVHSQYGSSTQDLAISTDGSYALPLVCEQGSIFERMAGDGGISTSQIMTYELTSLAQYRVLNGYGAASEFGPRGTESILTADDVRKAYSNAIDLIGILCFRTTDDTFERVDPADLLMGDEIVIDVSKFYGQLLMSLLDDMVLKWYDYLCIDYLRNHFDFTSVLRSKSVNCLFEYLGGTGVFDVSGYIADVMSSNDVPESDYRYPGAGVTSFSVRSIEVCVDNPVADVFGMPCVHDYGHHYLAETDYVRDLIRSVLNTAATKVFESYDSKTIAVTIDPHDTQSFIDTVSGIYRNLASECADAFDGNIGDVVDSLHYSDPFYDEIAEVVQENWEDFVLSDELESAIRDAVSKSVSDEDEIDRIMSSAEVRSAIQKYRHDVVSDLGIYDVLRNVPGGQPGIVLDLLSDVVSFGLRTCGITSGINDRADAMIDEMLSVSSLDPLSGIIALPGKDSFSLMDGDGNVTREKLVFEYDSMPSTPNPKIADNCIHITGFREESSAAYSTVFSVTIRDEISYRVTGTNALSSAFGESTSSFKDSIPVSMELTIPVASAWALVGVEYDASETVFSDAYYAFQKLLEPVMEPLRKIMEAIREIVEVLNEALMKVSKYVAEILAKLYEVMIEPIMEIATWIETELEALIGEGLLDYYYSLDLSKQSICFDYLGYTFGLTFDVLSLKENTKTLFTASLSGPMGGLGVSASVTAKVNGDMKAKNVFLTGKATVEGDNWSVKTTIDPLMKGSKHLLTMTAKINGAIISATVPTLEAYHETGLKLSDVPGVGGMLDNIPIPGLGVNLGLDAGISMKYSDPVITGLMINEFESNPPGTDNKNEWVELFNNSPSSVDLTGYTLVASSDHHSKVMSLSGTISPGEFMVITPEFSLVNTSGKLTKNGEGLTLKDPDGVIVDKTGTHKDNDDDERTWQRSYDGSGEWKFEESTMGRTNGTYSQNNVISVDIVKEIAWESLQDAFSEVGSITDMETLQEIVKLTVTKTVDGTIEHVAGCLVEASVFLKVDVSDPTSAASGGIRIALRCDSDLIEDTLKYVAGKIEAIALSIKNPYKIDGVAMFTDNIDLEVAVDARVGFPSILAKAVEDVPKVDVSVVFRTNISSLVKIYGKDVGTPEIECGLRIVDCPMILIPSKLSPKANMDNDLWLMKMTIQWK